METPFVTIITITRNRANLIPRCIESIQRQTYTNYEHIIVDGNSDDNTQEVVLAYNDPKIKYKKLDIAGPIQQMAAAFELSSGQYLTFLDDDDEYLPQRVEKGLAAFAGLPEDYGFTYASMDYYDNDTQQYLYTHTALHEGGKDILPIAISGPYICGTPTLMFRRAAFEAIAGGSWIPDIGNDMSDWALTTRCIKLGWKAAALKESLVKVYVNHSSERMTNYWDAAETGFKKTLLFHNHFLTEYSDVIAEHPRSAIYHLQNLMVNCFLYGDYADGFRYYLKLIKTAPTPKNLVYPCYLIFKRMKARISHK